jgi:hypothetical protein
MLQQSMQQLQQSCNRACNSCNRAYAATEHMQQLQQSYRDREEVVLYILCCNRACNSCNRAATEHATAATELMLQQSMQQLQQSYRDREEVVLYTCVLILLDVSSYYSPSLHVYMRPYATVCAPLPSNRDREQVDGHLLPSSSWLPNATTTIYMSAYVYICPHTLTGICCRLVRGC